MTVLAWFAQAGHWLLILAWSACHWQISVVRKRTCRPTRSDPGVARPRVTVILAARDEAAELHDCVARILAQEAVDLTLTIVNDRSSDATAEIAERLAATDRRCHVIHNEVLPAGWMGKSHACWLGARQADGEWLLFTDADVRLEPPAIASAIAYARRQQLDLFSLWPRDGSVGFWERLLIPLCAAMVVIWYGRVAVRSDQHGHAFANGQFLLIRKAVYDACGGHAAVRTALIEDIPLGRAVAARGFAVGSASGVDLVTVRMYRNRTEIINGWSRIYVGVLRPVQIIGCMASLLLGSVLPLLLAPIMLATVCLAGGTPWRFAWLLSAWVQLAVLMSVSARFFALARCDRRYLALYPLAVAGVLLILLQALWIQLFKRTVRWRGTAYHIAPDGRLSA